jgi:cytochrome c oxidase cbb3-type subunit III
MAEDKIPSEDKLPSEDHNDDYEIDTLTNERLIKDHEYDGIKELDNDAPSWFNNLFIGTIAFAVLYLYILFMFKPADLVQEKEFAREMARAATPANTPVAAAPTEARTFIIQLLTDEQSLASGQQTYNNLCAACHLSDGGGLVGPNLTDRYWIHGNSIEDLFKVVTDGVIEKGMLPYRQQLSQAQRLNVSSYILERLVGTTPASPKAPEGDFI